MTRVLPVERLTERSAENPTGVLFRDFTLKKENSTRDDGEKAEVRSIDIAISSEAPVLRYDWRSGTLYYEVLDHSPESVDLSYVADGIPFCLDHWLSKQVGIGESVAVGDDKMLRTSVRRGSHPDAPWVFADMDSGIRKKVSVSYDPGDEYTEIKGKDDEYPTRRYTRWTPYEVSSVTVPADYGVGVGRSAAGALLSTEAATTARNPESVMTDEEKAALARGNAATVDKSDELRSEQRAIAALAKQHGRESDLAGWVMDGLTLEQVRDRILTDYTRADADKPQINSGASVSGVRDRAEDKPWRDEAEFVSAVIRGTQIPHELDVRLKAERSQNTNTGTDGAFAVPPAVQTSLLEASKTGGEILNRVTARPITVGNSLKESVVKEDARTNGSRNGGLRGYWVAQEGDITVSQAKLREVELNLKKFAVAVPVTEEQMEDGPALVSFLQEQVPEELKFGHELAIWGGGGVGMPYGFMSSGALISVAIEGTQTIANTSEFIWKNAANMMTRMSPSAFLRSAYFINPALWAKLVTATAGTAANGAAPMFTPPGRLDSAPMGALYGRPIVPVEYASAEGTVGDFVLADLSDYLFASKNGIRYAASMHVEFLKDKQTLRWITRVDGQPRTRVPVTPLNGSVTVSPYVALAARS